MLRGQQCRLSSACPRSRCTSLETRLRAPSRGNRSRHFVRRRGESPCIRRRQCFPLRDTSPPLQIQRQLPRLLHFHPNEESRRRPRWLTDYCSQQVRARQTWRDVRRTANRLESLHLLEGEYPGHYAPWACKQRGELQQMGVEHCAMRTYGLPAASDSTSEAHSKIQSG